MITSYAYTDIGGREINEDSHFFRQSDTHNVYVVCDGLGGHDKGEEASALVTDVFADRFEEVTDENAESFIGDSLMIGQNMLISEQIARNAREDMKTTATAVMIRGGKIYRGYVGDSRIYVFNRNKVVEHTKDHSVPQMLVTAREIKEKDIRHHPDRNRLLRVMGIDWEEPRYQLEPVISVDDCQAILMCTDGFWELIDEKQMCRLLKKSSTVKEWINLMAEVVKKNGAGTNMDNNTALGIWMR